MNLTEFLFTIQDKSALIIMAAAYLTVGCFIVWRAVVNHSFGLASIWVERAVPARRVYIMAAGACAIALIGSALVFQNYAFTRDEMLVLFDSDVFASGTLAQSVPPVWQDQFRALQPELMRKTPGNTFFMTAYLPMNALLHVPGVLLGYPAIVGAFLTSISVLASFGAARRIAPDAPMVAVVAALLVATSPQVLINGMTVYAYNAHLALNMLFLWLLLGTSIRSAVGAVCVAFILTGLHQFIFPLLFATPFLIAAVRQGHKRRAVVIGSAMASSALFWLRYPDVVTMLMQAQQPVADATSGGGVVEGPSLRATLQSFAGHFVELLDQEHRFDAMGYNLVRLVAWQNPALLLFALFGIWKAWSRPRIWPLWAGAVLTLLLVGLIQPNQTHGWGYRYLHGHLGAFAILAGVGFAEVTKLPGRWPALRTAFTPLTAITLVLLLPLLALTSWMLVTPYRTAQAQIAALDADMVLVNWYGIAYGPDLVRNGPFLKRPININPFGINPDHIKTLCQQGTMAFFEFDATKNPGLPWLPKEIAPDQARLLDRDWYRANGCKVVN